MALHSILSCRSTDYGDELTWAAAWLYKATDDPLFLDEAEHHYMKFRLKERPNEFFYNKKVAGVQVCGQRVPSLCTTAMRHSSSHICPCVRLLHCEDVWGCTGKFHKLLNSAAVGDLLPWVKWQESEVNHSSPSDAQVKNAWSFASNPHNITSLFCGLYNGAVSM